MPCGLCWDDFCLQHDNVNSHPCHQFSYSSPEVMTLMQLKDNGRHMTKMAIVYPMVKHAAAALRPGIPFEAILPDGLPMALGSHKNPLQRSWIRGGSNLHISVTYADGVKWLARFRHDRGAKTVRQEEAVPCEFATMDVLHCLAPDFIPMVIRPLTTYPVDFFFMSFAQGRAIDRGPWKERLRDPDFAANVVHGLATFYIQLSGHSFDGIGSLYPGPTADTPRVGHFVNFNWDYETVPIQGPFHTNQDRWLSIIDTKLYMGENDLYHRDVDCDLVQWYLYQLELRDLVAADDEMAMEEPSFIRQQESKINQFLLVEDGTVSALLDWEGSYVVPFAEAFAAPEAFMDAAAFSRGDNKAETMLHAEYIRRGRPELARAIHRGKKYQRLAWESVTVRNIIAIRELFLGSAAPPHPSNHEEWKYQALEKYARYPGLQRVVQIAAARDQAMASAKVKPFQHEALNIAVPAG